jgi:cystathionine beta-lyase
MSTFDFDHLIDRSQSHSEKWSKYQDLPVLPMWVADTDFASPPCVMEALHQRIDHGVFGYTHTPDELVEVFIARAKQRYDWSVTAESLVWLPGLVCGLNLACRSVGESGDQVLSATPIYPPFISAPKLSDRVAVKVPMKEVNQRWVIDLEGLKAQLTDRTRLVLFCNPHNPGDTVYRKEELDALAAFVIENDLYICSDEIHCDLILEPGLEHIPIASLSDEISKRTITLMAPSKTFNIAGLGCSVAIIPDPTLRSAFNRVRRGIVPDANLLGYTAALAAYKYGDDWNQAQCAYLKSNRDYLMQRLNALPGVSLRPIEATYLAWIDFSGTDIQDLPHTFEDAGVGMSPGRDFGNDRFMRLNFGCQRSRLEEAVARIERVFTK